MAQGYGPRWLATRACAPLWPLAALICSPAFAASWTVEGSVVGVSDGDTITVLDPAKVQHKIRLSGIDAPEKGQAFGNSSKESLSKLVFDRQIEAQCHKKARYGREVCKVMSGGTDMNLEQLRAGMAWRYREYAKEQSAAERAEYAREEETAKASCVGLWKDAKSVPPWEWRRDKRTRRAFLHSRLATCRPRAAKGCRVGDANCDLSSRRNRARGVVGQATLMRRGCCRFVDSAPRASPALKFWSTCAAKKRAAIARPGADECVRTDCPGEKNWLPTFGDRA
jgi:endonuclease YncB( thermonuclease family)